MVGGFSCESWLSGQSENTALGQRLVEHGALDLAPLGEVVSAYDDHIGGNAQSPQLAAKPDRLSSAVIDFGLDHEEVEVAVGAGIAAGVGSEQDDLSRLAGGPSQSTSCLFDQGFVDHDLVPEASRISCQAARLLATTTETSSWT